MILHPRTASRRVSLIPLYYALASIVLALSVHWLSRIETPFGSSLASVRRSFDDQEDRMEAGQEDRQGIGVTRLPEPEPEGDA